jgi:ribonucleoside-triphosphate reductase
MEKYVCNDCNKCLEEGDEYVPYKTKNEIFIKCKECHQKDPVLRNFQETEVYSRVVGYIRPVKQWNKGKKEEFKDRKMFVVKD